MADICLNHAEHVKKFDDQSRINQDHERRLSDLEKTVAVNQRDADLRLEGMDKKLDVITNMLSISQSRLPNLVWGLIGSVGGGIVAWVILEFLKK